MPMPRWEAQLDKDKNCWFFHELSVDDALIDPWILDSPGQAWNGFQLSQQLGSWSSISRAASAH